MGDVAVENPANNVTPLTKPGALDALANLDSLDGTGADGNDEYATLKRLQRHLEYVWLYLLDGVICTDVEHRYIQLQEEYIKDEQRYAY
jgi:26S proteasome regulatory subunit T3